MSFQTYLDNIKAKTGKSADDFKKLGAKKGLLKAETKAGEIVAWLKKDFELGHGHAMAIYAFFNGKKPDKPAATKTSGSDFPGKIAQPAQRALANAGITSWKQLAKLSEPGIAALHGIGANALLELKISLKEQGLSFSTGKK